jgi:hypothetical protein
MLHGYICGTCRIYVHVGESCLCPPEPFPRGEAPQLSIFKPYVEENLGPAPVLLESKAQRDAALAQSGFTYDTLSRPTSKRHAWEHDDDWKQDVAEALRSPSLIAQERARIRAADERLAADPAYDPSRTTVVDPRPTRGVPADEP